MTSATDELERQLRQQLIHLQRQYERAAEPIVRQLMAIYTSQVPQAFVLQEDDLKKRGIIPHIRLPYTET